MIPMDLFNAPGFNAGISVDPSRGPAAPVQPGPKATASSSSKTASFKNLLAEAHGARPAGDPVKPERPAAAETAASSGPSRPVVPDAPADSPADVPADAPADATGEKAGADPSKDLLALLSQLLAALANPADGALPETGKTGDGQTGDRPDGDRPNDAGAAGSPAPDPGRLAAEILEWLARDGQACADHDPRTLGQLVDGLRKAGAADLLKALNGLSGSARYFDLEPGEGAAAKAHENLDALTAQLKTAITAAAKASLSVGGPGSGREASAGPGLPAEAAGDPPVPPLRPAAAEVRVAPPAAPGGGMLAALSHPERASVSPDGVPPPAQVAAPEKVKPDVASPAVDPEPRALPAEIPPEARSRHAIRVSDPQAHGQDAGVRLPAAEETPGPQGEAGREDGSREPGGETTPGSRLPPAGDAAVKPDETLPGPRFETAMRDPRPAAAPEGQVHKPGESLAAGHEKEAGAAALRSGVFDQIVRRAALHQKDSHSEMRIDLKPEHLGQVRLQIVTDNQQVSVRIVTELAAVRDMLETHLSQLKTDLQQQGLQVDRLEVSVAADHRQAPNRQAKGDRPRAPAAFGRTGIENDGGVEAAAMAVYAARPAGRGAIDMFI
jgi:flagellar hook-length control protein FliK